MACRDYVRCALSEWDPYRDFLWDLLSRSLPVRLIAIHSFDRIKGLRGLNALELITRIRRAITLDRA